MRKCSYTYFVVRIVLLLGLTLLNACNTTTVKSDRFENTGEINGTSASASSEKKPFSEFQQAMQSLNQTLAQLGYDTSDGEHSLGLTRSFLANPLDKKTTPIRINTGWDLKTPMGDYRELAPSQHSDKTIKVISRLNAVGPWTNCRNLHIEFLSTRGIDAAMDLFMSVRRELQC